MNGNANGFWVLILIAGLSFGAVALAVLLRAVKRGAFDDAEDTKFVVFRNDEDEEEGPPPDGGHGV